jgi:hypothetical protein
MPSDLPPHPTSDLSPAKVGTLCDAVTIGFSSMVGI